LRPAGPAASGEGIEEGFDCAAGNTEDPLDTELSEIIDDDISEGCFLRGA